MTETHKRTITRIILWRLIATGVTAIWTGLSGAVIIHLTLVFLHYLYERVWLKVHWGRAS